MSETRFYSLEEAAQMIKESEAAIATENTEEFMSFIDYLDDGSIKKGYLDHDETIFDYALRWRGEFPYFGVDLEHEAVCYNDRSEKKKIRLCEIDFPWNRDWKEIVEEAKKLW